MVHTTPEIATSNLILDFEFDQHLESHKHVISIIMGFRDTGCYTRWLTFSTLLAHREKEPGGLLHLYLSRMFFAGHNNIIARGETPLVDGVVLGGVVESSQSQADSWRCESR
jgi:hypothetical protein